MLRPGDALTFWDYLRMPPGLIDPDVIPVTLPGDVPPDQGDAQSAVPADLRVSELAPPPLESEPSWTHPVALQATAAAGAPRLPRIVHVGCIGGDVLAFKRALTAAYVRPKDASRHSTPRQRRTMGLRMASEVRLYQREHGLHADGAIGPQTYASLNRHKRIDAYGFWLLRQEEHRLHSAKVNPRTLAIHHALRAVALAGYWHYAQTRPFPVWEAADHVPTYTDCSGGYGLWLKWGGMPSPFGPLGWSGYGNTDTMLNTGVHVGTPGTADAILYSNPGHVVLCTRWPMGVSFGSEAGPYYLDARYRPITTFRHY